MVADESLNSRLHALHAPVNRAKALLEYGLVWPELPDGPATVFLFFGAPGLEDNFKIVEKTRTAAGIDISLGIPASLIPAHTPLRHLDVLRLLIDAVPTIADALGVSPPKLKPDE